MTLIVAETDSTINNLDNKISLEQDYCEMNNNLAEENHKISWDHFVYAASQWDTMSHRLSLAGHIHKMIPGLVRLP